MTSMTKEKYLSSRAQYMLMVKHPDTRLAAAIMSARHKTLFNSDMALVDSWQSAHPQSQMLQSWEASQEWAQRLCAVGLQFTSSEMYNVQALQACAFGAARVTMPCTDVHSVRQTCDAVRTELTCGKVKLLQPLARSQALGQRSRRCFGVQGQVAEVQVRELRERGHTRQHR
jgi:hypothetical protein